MLCKLGATGPNFLSVLENDIFHYSTKFYVIWINGFLRYEIQKIWDFPVYCMVKWAGGHKLSSNMASTI